VFLAQISFYLFVFSPTKIDVWLNGQALFDPVFKWCLSDLKMNLSDKSYSRQINLQFWLFLELFQLNQLSRPSGLKSNKLLKMRHSKFKMIKKFKQLKSWLKPMDSRLNLIKFTPRMVTS